MLHPVTLLEGIALDIHEGTGGLLPVDAFELADLCGLSVRPWWRAQGALVHDEIRYPARARFVRQHGVVAHELGHWALARADEEDCEDSARYLAGALMLPRVPFLRDLAETDWDLTKLRDRHPNASAEMIVVRMTQVSAATAWVWDNGKLARRYGIPAEAPHDVINEAVMLEGNIDIGPVRAWTMIDRSHRRVLAVQKAR